MGRARHPAWLWLFAFISAATAFVIPVSHDSTAFPTGFRRILERYDLTGRARVSPHFVEFVIVPDVDGSWNSAVQYSEQYERIANSTEFQSAGKRVLINLTSYRSGLVAHTKRELRPASVFDAATGQKLPPLSESEILGVIDSVTGHEFYDAFVRSIEKRLRLRQVTNEIIFVGWVWTIVFAISALATPFVTLRAIQGTIQFRRRLTNRCAACGYRLEGLTSDTCPECGETTRAGTLSG